MQAKNKRIKHTLCVIKASAQLAKGGGGGGMPQFCMLFYADYTIMATQRGAMAQCLPPPLNTPLPRSRVYRVQQNRTIDFLLVYWKQTVCLFFFAVYLFDNMPIRPISVTVFFGVHLFYEYAQSNQSNTRNHKKPSQQEQTFCLECSSWCVCFWSVY